MENLNKQKINTNFILDDNNLKPRKRKHSELMYNNNNDSEKNDIYCNILSKKFENLNIEKHFKITENSFKANHYKDNSSEIFSNNNICNINNINNSLYSYLKNQPKGGEIISSTKEINNNENKYYYIDKDLKRINTNNDTKQEKENFLEFFSSMRINNNKEKENEKEKSMEIEDENINDLNINNNNLNCNKIISNMEIELDKDDIEKLIVEEKYKKQNKKIMDLILNGNK
jgi:hypothetical protein